TSASGSFTAKWDRHRTTSSAGTPPAASWRSSPATSGSAATFVISTPSTTATRRTPFCSGRARSITGGGTWDSSFDRSQSRAPLRAGLRRRARDQRAIGARLLVIPKTLVHPYERAQRIHRLRFSGRVRGWLSGAQSLVACDQQGLGF